MKLFFSTKKSYLIYGIVFILCQPFFTISYYVWNQKSGAYSPHADSIGIPIFQELAAFPFLAFIAIAGIIYAGINFPGSIKVRIINFDRKIWSICWFLLFLFFILTAIQEGVLAMKYFNVIHMLNSITWVHVFCHVYLLIKEKKGWI